MFPSRRSSIPRSLDESWAFSPDWRHQVVEEYLRTSAAMLAQGFEDPVDMVLDGEADTYIRQFFQYRFGRKTRLDSAFRYVEAARSNRQRPNASSLIRAMSVAGLTAAEIAQELGTSRRNIAVFLKLIFDVERYKANRSWMHQVVFGRSTNGNDATGDDNELLAIAFTQGRRGLAQILHGASTLDPEARLAAHERICATLTVRAEAFLANLQARAVPPTGLDFERFMRLAEGSRNDIHETAQAKEIALRDMLIAALHRKAKEQPDNEKLQAAVQKLPLPEAAEASDDEPILAATE